MPVFPSDLRGLTDEALARIVDDEDGPASNRVDPEDWKQWRAILTRRRAVLAPTARLGNVFPPAASDSVVDE